MNDCGAKIRVAAPHKPNYTRKPADYQGISSKVAPVPPSYQSLGTRKSAVSLDSGVPGAGFQS